jgi:2-isopropylmalate synthase
VEGFHLYGVYDQKTAKAKGREVSAEATVKVRVGKEVLHTAAEGDGPVNALDNALRKAICHFFPALQTVRLEDYKVRVLDAGMGTGSGVRVVVESTDGVERWSTVGVSTNVVEASFEAILDSFLYKLWLDAEKTGRGGRSRVK